MAYSELEKANNSSIEADMLSNLPNDVKERIITYLSLEEAGRTSILSSKWRYTWASIPVLNLGGTGLRMIRFVDAIFVLHIGPIRKFSIFTSNEILEALDRWIVNLSRNGIRELKIHLDCEDEHYMMHSKFFSCDELNYVDLSHCAFKVPQHFGGFTHLHTLALSMVRVSDDDLEKLISSCPPLKKLNLMDLWQCRVLKIRAPNLLYLKILAQFSDLQLCAPKLHSLSVEQNCFPYEKSFQHSSWAVLDNVPDLEKLELKGGVSEYLSHDPLPEEFPLTFHRLTNLSLILNCAEVKEVAFVVALLKRAPHLRSLNIEVDLRDGPTLSLAEFWQKEEPKLDLFKQLRTVNIFKESKMVGSVLLFVRFILGSAPKLVTLTISECMEERTTFKHLLEFERASPKAKIILKEFIYLHLCRAYIYLKVEYCKLFAT